MKVLVFAGTTEGNQLALGLAQRGIDVLVSCATETGTASLPGDMAHLSTRYGALPHEDMLQLVADVDLVVDATHPYAQDISRHVSQACQELGAECIRILRPASDTEGCILVDSVAQAAQLLAGQGEGSGNILSTTGSKELACYQCIPGYRQRLFARVLDDPASVEAGRALGLADSHILAGRGPFSLEDNLKDIDGNQIRWLVTKDGGKAGGFPEKIQAARARDVQAIVIRRPQEGEGMEMEEALELITGRMG